MRRALAACAALLGGRAAARPELLPYDPVAAAGAAVADSAGTARFTVLTPRLIRMELAASRGAFEDRATLAVVNRALPVPAFSHAEAGGVLTITTAAVELSYAVGAGFSRATLRVAPAGGSAAAGFGGWAFGDAAPGNLLGTIRSLDKLDVPPLNCSLATAFVWNESQHCEWGLVSRDGWAIYNDTAARALGPDDWWAPEPAANADAQDLYGFFHGLDFRGALADYTLVGGRAALLPRAASGVWWTRWYNFDADDVERVVDAYDARRLPLDVFTMDMDWHSKNDWGGVSFDANLFAFPADTTAYAAARGLAFGMNLHDADGVGAWEPTFPALVAALGLPENSTSVPLNLVNATYAYAVEDVAFGPLFYDSPTAAAFQWIDWQQGGRAGGLDGEKANPTIWLAKLRSTNRHRRGSPTRGMVLTRFGGLGAHRYLVGFSGDVGASKVIAERLTWPNLAFQPFFSATAANVAYAWSHDIVGPAQDPELFVRWLQWGAFSGVMRSHGRGLSQGPCANEPLNISAPGWAPATGSCALVEPWNLSPALQAAARGALLARARLLPLAYTAARRHFETGVGLVAPLYYDWPREPRAYAMDGTSAAGVAFLFSADVLVSPVVAPAGGAPGAVDAALALANVSTWLPPGAQWYSATDGALRAAAPGGDAVVAAGAAVDEVPAFVRAGAVLPFLPLDFAPSLVGLAARGWADALGFCVTPGAAAGAGAAYEDDGATTAYLGGAFAWTTAAYARHVDGGGVTVTISTNGSFEGLPAARAYAVRLLDAGALARVTANGAPVPFARRARARGFAPPVASFWAWEADAGLANGAGALVLVAGAATRAPLVVDVRFASAAALPRGLLAALDRARRAKDALDADHSTPGSTAPGPAALSRLAGARAALAHLAGADAAAFDALAAAAAGAMLDAAVAEVANMTGPRAAFAGRLLAGALAAREAE